MRSFTDGYYVMNYNGYNIFKESNGYYTTDYCSGMFLTIEDIKDEINGFY